MKEENKRRFDKVIIALKGLVQVEEIDLSTCEIGDKELEILCEALTTHFNLRSLDLSHNNISDAGLKKLAAIIDHNRFIKRLNLANNKIGHGNGVEVLVRALSFNDLEYLNLAGNKIGPEGIRPLTQLYRANGNLVELYLGNNQLGFEGTNELLLATVKNSFIPKEVFRYSANCQSFFCGYQQRQVCVDGNSYEEWMAFLPPSNTIMGAWHNGNFATQIAYMKGCYEATQEAANMLSAKHFTTIKDLYLFLAGKRQKLSKVEDPVGMLRTATEATYVNYAGTTEEKAWYALLNRRTVPLTPISESNEGKVDRYTDQYPLVHELFDYIYPTRKVGHPPCDDSFVNYQYNRYGSCTHSDGISVSVLVQCQGLPLKIAQIVAGGCVLSTMQDDPTGKSFTIFHPFCDVIDTVFEIIEPFFKDALTTNNSVTLYQDIGVIAWFLAQAMPTFRGNAAITEMVFRSIILANKNCGEGLYPAKRGKDFLPKLTWDLQAIIVPDPHVFAKNFHNLFYTKSETNQFVDQFTSFMDANSAKSSFSSNGNVRLH